jgi:menaquinone-dependent protoporphyrinogen oxidase
MNRRCTMPDTILVAYATKHGSTREVAEAVAEALQKHGLAVETLPAARVVDVSPYAGVVVGGALYMGRWHPDAVEFLEQHRHALATLPLAAFGMGPRTMGEHDAEESRTQLVKALAKVPEIDPCAVAIFGGVIDPHTLHFPFSHLPASDARDWSAIRAWATDFAGVFSYGKAAPDARDPRSELQQSPR